MPNHIQNYLTCKGPAERIREMFEFIESEEEAFDFNKVIPMPEALNIESGSKTDRGIELHLTALNPQIPDYGRDSKMQLDAFYHLVAMLNSTRRFSRYRCDLTAAKRAEYTQYTPESELLEIGQKAITNFVLYGAPTWYEWCVAHWGTKWGAYSCCDTEDGFSFQTAWSAPLPVIQRLSELFPELELTLKYADEDIGSNCGKVVFKGGERTCTWTPKKKAAIRFACEIWDEDPKEYLTEEEEE